MAWQLLEWGGAGKSMVAAEQVGPSGAQAVGQVGCC